MGRRGAPKKEPRRARTRRGIPTSAALDGRHVRGLLALRTLDDLELDGLALGQGLEAFALDGRVVHEHVLAARLLDESETLRPVEPLHGAFLTHGSRHLLPDSGPPLTSRPRERPRTSKANGPKR